VRRKWELLPTAGTACAQAAMQSEISHSFKKTLPQTSCCPAHKRCLPSELVTRFMSKFIDVDFELRDAVTQRV